VTEKSSTDLAPPEREPDGRWRPGQSGNPGGVGKTDRELMARVRALALQHSEAAVGTLVQMMTSEKTPHAARIAAASAVLDRGIGKPQPQESLPGEPHALELEHATQLERARRIAWLLEAGIRATRMQAVSQVPARLAADDDDTDSGGT
jgi:hypothetical protein